MRRKRGLDAGGRKRRRLTRRKFLKAAGALAAGLVGAGWYPVAVEPVRVEVSGCALPVPRLPPAWEGARLALIADLHHSPWVSARYLTRCMRLVEDLRADLVAVSGDFVTYRGRKCAERVAGIVGTLAPPLGTFACLGNHDYGLYGPAEDAKPHEVADHLAACGVRVLRNEAARLTRGGEDLWIVGMEDLWSGHFRPEEAMKHVPAGAASIVLCHNPDGAERLAACGCGAILSGHTHGGQIQLPGIGPLCNVLTKWKRYEGMHRVGPAWLYINRGLGSHVRVRFRCRPEVSVLALRRAEAAAGAPSA